MSLKEFFYPKSIAIVGASAKLGKVGYTLVKKLEFFPGKIFYINIEGYEINGKLSYKSLKLIKENIDLAIIAVQAQFVKDILEDCTYKKIRNVIIISAGFGDIGRKDREEEILKIAKAGKIRILGPNNFGLVNTAYNLDCTFSKLKAKPGYVAFASQSGALWSFIADYSRTNNLGFSKFISFGDMLDIEFNEALEYLIKDKETKVILLYIETIKNGKEFMNLVKKSKKPIVIVKAGKTEKGKVAVHSHTGSLAGSYEIYKAACKQAGAFFAETLTEALDLAKFLSMQQKPKGNKTLVITNAGGPGVLLSDILIENNLKLIDLPPNLKFNLPPSWSHNNPIDLIGDATSERFKEVLEKIQRNRFYNNVVIILTPQDMTDSLNIAQQIIRFHKISNVPTICCPLGNESFKKAIELLEKNSIPCFQELERTARLLGNLVKD